MEHLASPRSSLSAYQKQVAERDGADGEDWWWWLPLPRRLGGQLPAGCGGLLLLGHDGGGDDQELVARLEKVKV